MSADVAMNVSAGLDGPSSKRKRYESQPLFRASVRGANNMFSGHDLVVHDSRFRPLLQGDGALYRLLEGQMGEMPLASLMWILSADANVRDN